MNPAQNKYAYKLDGFDTDWQYPDQLRRFAYYNLPAGTYKFHLKAANSNGIWGEREPAMEIVILPPPRGHGGHMLLRCLIISAGQHVIQNGKACAAVQCFAFARTGKSKSG